MVHDEEIVSARTTFKGFVSLMTWGAIASAIIGLLVIVIIS